MVSNKIVELKEIVVSQSARVEKMLNNCMKGLNDGDSDALNKVIDKYERKLNKKEIQIDEIITGTIALFHPEAKDLRYVLMMARMNYDIERMGDLCVEIAESASFVIKKKDFKSYADLMRMFSNAVNLLQESIRAFIDEDLPLALAICRKDDEIEVLCNQIFTDLLAKMQLDAKIIESAWHIINISNAVVKIASLAVNIAEETVYIVEGRIIKQERLKGGLKN